MSKINARELHDELLLAKPEGARHDADICSFCVDNAAQVAPVPSGPEAKQPESKKGGTTTAMSDNENAPTSISMETHQALLEKALKDAVSTTEKALETKIHEKTELEATVKTLTEEKASLETDNARLNTELDTTQLSLKSVSDEFAALKGEIAAKEEAALKTELAAKRTEQVKALALFPEEFIADKATRWADMAEEDWNERVEEWQARKPASTSNIDSASAMSGTSGDLTTEVAGEVKTTSTRRSVLGI